MKLYDSYSGELKELEIKNNKVDIYVCGPTVYNNVHIGNMRPVIVFDIINRLLINKGVDVNYSHNFTDIDDKIIDAAKKENIDELTLSNKYIDAYNKVLKQSNVITPTNQPKVTDNIIEIISYISELINLGYAYERNGNVYFRVNQLKEYGQLSKIKLDQLKSNVRKEINALSKENEHDFALWKNTDEGFRFDSPWGRGRPGWHTECDAFIDKYHDGILDIHGGGIDLKFPHHENELAQCLAKNNHKLTKIWVHIGHLKVNGEKMSKSLNNFLLAKDAIKEYGANMVRMILLSAPHTQPIDFNDDVVNTTRKQYEKISRLYKELRLKTKLVHQEYENKYNFSDKFIYELENNLNVPNAMSVLNDLIKVINKSISNKDRTYLELSDSFNLIVEKILGLKYEYPPITQKDIDMYNEWMELKNNREFDKADELRYKLSALEII